MLLSKPSSLFRNPVNSMKAGSLRVSYPTRKWLSSGLGWQSVRNGNPSYLLGLPTGCVVQGCLIQARSHTATTIRYRSFPFKATSFSRSFPSLRTIHSSRTSHIDRLQNLEDAANRDRGNARTQAVFLEVVVRYLLE